MRIDLRWLRRVAVLLPLSVTLAPFANASLHAGRTPVARKYNLAKAPVAEILRPVTLISVSLAGVSIMLGAIGLWMSISQSRKLKHITSSISTRFVGEFPAFLPHINTLLGNAKTGSALS